MHQDGSQSTEPNRVLAQCSSCRLDVNLGGYQVLKKWLSYRERSVLDRALTPHEVQYFSNVARRIAAMLTIPRHAPSPAVAE